MKTRALIIGLLLGHGCASITGTQDFATDQQYSLPNQGAITLAGSTIVTVSAMSSRTFAAAVLDDIDDLRNTQHIDSADASVQVRSVQLATNTTFSGVKAIWIHLVTESQTIELCNRILSASDEQLSSVGCSANYRIDEAALQTSAGSSQPARIDVQLELEGDVTATELTSTVAFEVEVNVDASL